jgi:hypothetical protein
MRVGAALKLAGRDMFDNSWRLVPINAALGIVLVAVGLAAVAVHALLVLAALAGPVAAALVHCAVKLVRTGNVKVADAWEGLRAHWQRGLQLGAAGTALAVLAAVAVRFYARTSFGWPLAFLTIYVVVLLGIFAVVLTTFAVAEPDEPLRHAAREAAALGAERPGATLLLGLSLLLVNLAGVAAAVMPFLTLTVAYSFVAVAHFALPRPSKES